jgi:hypothetical protein
MTWRPAVPKSVQVEVFFRDRCLCHIRRRPVVFAMTFKPLSEVLGLELPDVPIAMYHPNWRRDKAPLLDELGATVHHIQAYAAGGPHEAENFAAAGNRCYTRKGDPDKAAFLDPSLPQPLTANTTSGKMTPTASVPRAPFTVPPHEKCPGAMPHLSLVYGAQEAAEARAAW